MGRRGPARTPTPILEARGSPRGKLRAKTEPPAKSGRPRCPAKLTKDEQVVWRSVVAILEGLDVLATADGRLIARYCRLSVRLEALDVFIEEHGVVYPLKTAKGTLLSFRIFPTVKAAEKIADQLLRIEQELGLSPASRARLSVTPAKPKDDLADFVAGKPDLKVVGAG